MKQRFSKIVLFILITGLITACNSIKNVSEGERLLVKNTIYVDSVRNTSEQIDNLLYQEPNKTMLGLPIRLYIYNLARPNIDSIIDTHLNKTAKHRERLERFLSKKQLSQYINSRKSLNAWLKTTGEAPSIINEPRAIKSVKRLEDYYINNGWFDVSASYDTILKPKQKVEIAYHVNRGTPYKIDSISTKIMSPVVDSIYNQNKRRSFIKKGERYTTDNFKSERDRITSNLRNNGIYQFSQDYVIFQVDTVETNKKMNVEVQIKNYSSSRNADSIQNGPFKVYKIKDVNIYTDNSHESREYSIKDTIKYNGYNLYSVQDKIAYKPKALTDAIFISPGNIFRDIDRTRTYKHLSELKTFRYPDINYIENPDTTLTANIFLTPLKKFNLDYSLEVSQSNIQIIGFTVSSSLLARNIFKGAETLELSGFATIGASDDAADDKDKFFDINELGADLKLTIPRIFFPINTDSLIPKTMSPTTRIGLSIASQTNVGLDKRSFTGSLNYNWRPKRGITQALDLFNAQYVRNLNPDNYFNVYSTSYDTLDDIAHDIDYIPSDEDLSIPDGTNEFIDEVLSDNPPNGISDDDIQTVNNIDERMIRLTENNLIVSSAYSFIKDSRRNPSDEDFFIFRFKLESAGNLLALGSKLSNSQKNEDNQYELFNVAYSQFIKTEFDYTKHWDLGHQNIFAIRAFFGIAIPYGNSNNIPFAKSFFAGGANDNRAWTAYDLGPGSSQSNDDFNEANLKLALNMEHRFNVFEDLYGALFVDVGNIWNVFDNVDDEFATFDNFSSLKDTAIGTGFGLRYDFSFLVFRFDIGFKTYDPSYSEGERWFKDYNFGNAVYNVGINYPF
ncbi:surface antigen (D15) [Formosa agariphila KMM 3901]|uniref:Surface antigen (D15) n=1 Tax=Formosa agariphila (strain DSM 15362 / KCTC 12365 / LMG 23005 / KMM 3901 / M-2Alg 35-1) TaxID=1347342 RepID=T2KIE0_FORAG|nr:BamA/TamA family outer membrane protein [Formosa agariphila]CDF78191.1 surface antigen (D15) [Formosa agariphila KMM 3901]